MPRWPRRFVAFVAAGAVLAVGYAAWTWKRGGDQTCADGAEALVDVWDPATKRAIQAAFEQSGEAYSRVAWSTVETELDAYAERWLSTHEVVCGPGLDGAPSPSGSAGAQTICLDRSLAQLAGLTRSLRDAQHDAVRGAVEAVANLPSPARCGKVGDKAPPGGDEARERARWSEGELAKIAAKIRAARYDEATTAASALVSQAKAEGDPSLAARALLANAEVHRVEGRYSEAEGGLEEALEWAERAGDQETAFDALVRLTQVSGARLANYRDGMRYARLAQAKLDAQGGDRRRGISLLLAIGNTQRVSGRFEEAIETFDRAEALTRDMPHVSSVVIADIYNLRGVALDRVGRYGEALANYSRALEIRSDVLGEAHPRTANAASNVGVMLSLTGQYDLAERKLADAVARLAEGQGDNHPTVAWFSVQWAVALRALGRGEEALRLNERALDIGERTLGTGHFYYALFLLQQGVTLLDLKRYAEALAAADRARELQEANPDFNFLADVLVVRAAALREMGRLDEALTDAQAALEEAEAVRRPDPQTMSWALEEQGLVLLELDRPDEAAPVLRRAVSLCDGTEAPPIECTAAWFALAKSLRDVEPAPALDLARRALAVHRTDGHDPDMVAEIERFLGPDRSGESAVHGAPQ